MNSFEDRYFEILSYLTLIVVLIVLLFVFWFVSYNYAYQIYVAGIASAFYSLWGIIHAKLEGRLKFVVVSEYILISLLVFTMTYMAIHKY